MLLTRDCTVRRAAVVQVPSFVNIGRQVQKFGLDITERERVQPRERHVLLLGSNAEYKNSARVCLLRDAVNS